MHPVLYASVFGLIAAAVSVATLFAVRFAAKYTRAQAPLFAAFAAGLVIATAILHLMPDALTMVERAPLLVLAGFGAGFFLQRGIEAWPRTGRRAGLALVLAPVIAIALHSAIDGLVYAVTFTVDVFTGLSASLGLVVHEVPEAIICFVLLQRAGVSDRTAFFWAFIAAGATTLVAAAGAAPFAAALSAPMLGMVFAVVAGIMLHVGATHLLSHAGEAGWLRATPMVVFGALVAIAMTQLKDAAGHEGLPMHATETAPSAAIALKTPHREGM